MSARIIHVASAREWRGGQNQVRLLCQALERSGSVEQVVVTGRGSELASRLRDAQVPMHEAGWSTALDPRVLVALLSEIRRAPSLLHAHDAHALVLAGVAARLTGSRLVVTRRVDFHLRRPGFWARADRVIAISDAVRGILLRDGIPPDQVVVVHSGIDPSEVRAAVPSGIRASLGLAPNLPLVVNVAALVPHKDQMTLLAAANQLRSVRPDLQWIIAGDGPLGPDLRRRAEVLGLTDHVHFVGQVANPWGLIRDADVFVMSSREEGLGTSILDAMALGVPVVATRAGGIPEMLDQGAGLLVNVGDAMGLAHGVASVLNDADFRSRVQKLATERLERFTDRTMADGVLSVYRSILPNG
ncbi:MAG: glycosyltransferase [Gemmatimonadota bacterium]